MARNNTTESSKALAIQKQIKALRLSRQRLREDVRRLRTEVADARTALDGYAIRQWHASSLDVELIASGEPGVIAATSRLTTPSRTFAVTKDFHVLTICHSLPHLSPVTVSVWRDIIGNAAAILNGGTHFRTPMP